MPVYKNLKGIRKLSNASLTAIIDVTNLNFKDLSSANLEFLNNISYDENANSFIVAKGSFDFVNVTDTFSMVLDDIPTFTIDSLGRAEGRELLVRVAETKRLRLTDFTDWPTPGVPGEIIYTGIQNQRPEFGEDFIGYLQGRGWVSLTDLGGLGYFTLTELAGSPPVSPTPGANQGILWIGAPGFENTYLPTSQTLYYTDENGDIFDVMSNHIWDKIGDDAIFKLSGKVVIGSTTNPRSLQYIDGNQSANYVLTSDSNGNASWQPTQSGGGGNTCSFINIGTYSAGVPTTLVHGLNSTNIVVELIDITTNESVETLISNYQLNSIDITTTSTVSSLKVVILSGDCTGGGGGGTADKEVINFTATAGIPVILSHTLSTLDFTYNVREGNTILDVDLEIIDADNIQITSTANISAGVLILIG